jgi:gamma-glutamyltranspeptidase/glutathione hydrolase
MGSGLHHRTFQCLFNVMKFSLPVDQAINAPDFFLPVTDGNTGLTTVRVPKGRFPEAVLKGMGYAYEEVELAKARFAGVGLWVAISRDPKTGELRAASPNRNNSAAVAY